MSLGSSLGWAGIGLIGIVVLTPSLKREGAPPPVADKPVAGAASSAAPKTTAGNGLASRTLTRDFDGHFYVNAQVNGAQVRFMVDTGASIVALTPADAQRAGIARPSERTTARGAGGTIEVMPVMIDRIAIGPLEARDVRGAVVEEVGVSLLGQSFLEEVGSVEIRGDTMVLR
jgi:aspartyl protease family protein